MIINCVFSPPHIRGRLGEGLQYGILYHLTIEEIDDAVGVCSIVLAVGDHHDGGAFGVEL